MSELLAFFIQPLILNRWQQALLLLPLCLAISVVYKATKYATIREIPLAVLVNWVTIVVLMYVIGAILLVTYELIA